MISWIGKSQSIQWKKENVSALEDFSLTAEESFVAEAFYFFHWILRDLLRVFKILWDSLLHKLHDTFNIFMSMEYSGDFKVKQDILTS